MNRRTIAIIALSAFVVLLVSTGAISVFIKWRKSGRTSSAVGPAFTSSINKRSGMSLCICGVLVEIVSENHVMFMVLCISFYMPVMLGTK